MKRIAVLCVLAAMLAVVLIPQSAAASTNTMRVTAGIGLNVRTGPGLQYQIITAMPYGTVVTVTGWSGVWAKVNYNGISGWSHSGWLAKTSAAPVVATQSLAQSAPPESGRSCFWAHGGQVCAPAWIANIIYAAGSRYGVPGTWLMQTAACESGFDTGAVGAAGEIGVFQFKWGTYYGNGGSGDIWNVANQADTAARMFAEGLSYEWTCAR